MRTLEDAVLDGIRKLEVNDKVRCPMEPLSASTCMVCHKIYDTAATCEATIDGNPGRVCGSCMDEIAERTKKAMGEENPGEPEIPASE